jgi:hypothetical protein
MSTQPDDTLATLCRDLAGRRALSVYLDSAATDPAQRQQWKVTLDQGIARLRELVNGRSRAQRDELERALTSLAAHLPDADVPRRAPGWAAFASAAGVRFAGNLSHAVGTSAWWGDRPRIAPLVMGLERDRSTVVVVLDSRRAQLYRYESGGRVSRLEALHRRMHLPADAHMGDTPRPGFHSGTRGATTRDRVQRLATAAAARLHSDVVERALAVAGADGWILVAGIPRDRADVVNRIATRAPGRVAALHELDVHATPPAVARAAGEGVARLRAASDHREILSLCELMDADAAGVLGSSLTRHALDERQVGALFFTEAFAARAPDELEDALHSAIAQHAEVRLVTGDAAAILEERGGTGARLRYR